MNLKRITTTVTTKAKQVTKAPKGRTQPKRTDTITASSFKQQPSVSDHSSTACIAEVNGITRTGLDKIFQSKGCSCFQAILLFQGPSLHYFVARKLHIESNIPVCYGKP
jgi:hypothetical protein